MDRKFYLMVALLFYITSPSSSFAKDFSWEMFLPAIIGASREIAPPTCDSQHLYLCKDQASCESAGGTWHENRCNIIINGIIGVTQKGPMLLGSSVSIYEVNDQLDYTGDIYAAQVTNNKGDFKYNGEITAPYVEVIIQGFFFDEIGGKLSPAQLTIRALSSAKSKLNVNLLTTLEINRIKKLMLDGLQYDVARSQAEKEILTNFHIETGSFLPFSDMDISGSSDSDAVLLAISTVILQMAYNDSASDSEVVATLSFLLASLATDFEKDGALGTIHYDKYMLARAWIDTSAVRSNLENYYAQLGESYVAPPFENYINESPDNFDFTDLVDVDCPLEYTTNTITVSGLTDNGVANAYAVGTNGTVLDNLTIIKNSVPVSGNTTSVVNGDQIALNIFNHHIGETDTYDFTIGLKTDNVSLSTRKPNVAYTQGLTDSGWNAQQDVNSLYFAVPITPTRISNIKYLATAISGYAHDGSGTVPAPEFVAIYSDNSGVPGTVLISSSNFSGQGLGRWFNSGDVYTDLDGALVTLPISTLQVFLGINGINVVSGGRYWIVIKYAQPYNPYIIVTPSPHAQVPFSERKLSSDGITWLAWVHNGTATTDTPITFLTN